MGAPAILSTVLNPNDSGLPNFAERVCLPFLLRARHEDGGWGYHSAGASSVEPTAWCLLALHGLPVAAELIEFGRRWILAAQAPDGSWSTAPQTNTGNWTTALAGLALEATGNPAPAIAKAADWICKSEPGEVSFKARFRRWLAPKKIVEQDFSLRGWSWTPGTASWVEPTSVSLLFLHQLAPEFAPARCVERCQSAQAMLYDRMCPSGGWNLGNPKVYGVEGIPQIGPTAWALLALQDQSARSENRKSLDWLEKQFDSIGGPASLALASLALHAGGRMPPPLEPLLARLHQHEDFLDSTVAHAQALFALKNGPDVLRWNPQPR